MAPGATSTAPRLIGFTNAPKTAWRASLAFPAAVSRPAGAYMLTSPSMANWAIRPGSDRALEVARAVLCCPDRHVGAVGRSNESGRRRTAGWGRQRVAEAGASPKIGSVTTSAALRAAV